MFLNITNLYCDPQKQVKNIAPLSKVTSFGYLALSASAFASCLRSGAIALVIFEDILAKKPSIERFQYFAMPVTACAIMSYISYKSLKKAIQTFVGKSKPKNTTKDIRALRPKLNQNSKFFLTHVIF